ncbi:hypothetical protein U1Q18_019786 [Sarracenia purpurea var. burkii]
MRLFALQITIMEVELFTDGLSDDDNFSVDYINEYNNEDFSTFEGERCGICMDLVIDRGVLDCCQHWFCFTCIDNWATITNLCPLCQNEFQLITCVPVYDTIGSNKADEDAFSREDDWCIEGKTNTLSFPSYYIDENAVICLGGDGCKVQSGSVTIEEDSNLDTSIACDSCDTWYHAFCVGFDAEGTCENSWLCPRCIANENPQKSDEIPVLRSSYQSCPENASSECVVNAVFSGKVSVSVADAGETAVVVSMVERNQVTEEKPPLTSKVDNDLKIEMLVSSSTAKCPKLETASTEKTIMKPVCESHEVELCLSQDSSFNLSCNSLGQSELRTSCDDKPSGFEDSVISSGNLLNEAYSANEPCESSLDLQLGLSVDCSSSVDDMKNDVAEDQANGDIQQKAGHIVPDIKITGSKRKLRDCRRDDHTIDEEEETEAKVETKASTRKVRVGRNNQMVDSKDQADDSILDESQKCISEKVNAASDIMSIVQGTDRRPFKGHAHNNHADNSSRERENAVGLRMKKIMRRAVEDKESSILVQKIRKEIREAVRNKSSKEFGENFFDPKLLAAFRAAVAGSITEPPKGPPTLVVKSKKLMLQKGKIRENLTKKIYGMGGRRKRAWTRDCEIEFWKHRCLKASKPEKIETLKSVLNLLRKSSDGTEVKQGNEGKPTSSILSRLYLADTSVFPRKEDVKPLSDLKTTGLVENNGQSLMQMNKVSSQVGIPLSNIKGDKRTAVTSVKAETSREVHPSKRPEGPHASSLSGSKVNYPDERMCKSNEIKKDKRKWALEVLARKTAATSSNAINEKEDDNAVLKGKYPLLAQLPIEMRPVLAPSHHNKIPISVRQAKLYRLTEHFLRKANLPVIRRTADTELAVADAVNIEKEVAERSNSKLVYVNLMSQELLHRSDNIGSCRATESDPTQNSAVPADRSKQTTNNLSDDLMVEDALRNAGFLSDSSPISPCDNDNVISSAGEVEHEPDNVFEMDSHPELDIYGDFEYDLEDEDFIGASASKISNLQQEEPKMKVVFSTVDSNKPNNVLNLDGHENATAGDLPEVLFCLPECGTDSSIRSSSESVRAGDCLHQDPLTDGGGGGGGGGEPSLAECEELYGPDKEPLMKRFPESLLIKPSELMDGVVVPKKSGYSGNSQTAEASGSESCAENVVVPRANVHASGEENVPACSETSENVPTKEKLSNTSKKMQSDKFKPVSQKVKAYIKEHIRPLFRSGVITVEQYRWAVRKTTDKVMKYHSKEKNANFLIKEGEKVKKLAGQYVEAAQQMEKK